MRQCVFGCGVLTSIESAKISSEQFGALRRVVRKTSRGALYALSLGVIALAVGTHVPPELATFVNSFLANGLSEILNRIIRGEVVPDSEIDAAIDTSDIAKLLNTDAQTQGMVGRLFRRMHILQTVAEADYDLSRQILGEIQHFTSLAAELRDQIESMRIQLESVERNTRPRVFSRNPRSIRPVLTQKIVGRLADWEWLWSTTGDRLMVGQPGSGKTFLLSRLVDEGLAWYLVEHSDYSRVAAGFEAPYLPLIIVDDVNENIELLAELNRIRSELGISFSIVASCWPSYVSQIKQVLSLPDDHCRSLEQLTLDQIVEVVKDAGIHGPNELLQEIANQSEGLPGLAVTLVSNCLLNRNSTGVWTGEVIRNTVLTPYGLTQQAQVKSILAAFSIGGAAGTSTC